MNLDLKLRVNNKKIEYAIKGKYKLLASSDLYFLYCKGRKIYAVNKHLNNNKLTYIGQFSLSHILDIVSFSRLAQRCFRLEPRCAIFIDDENALISMHGAVYKVSIPSKSIEFEHHYRAGMNNPLTFSRIKNIKSFDDMICYGEYFGNADSEEVYIWGRKEKNNIVRWEKLYAFPANSILHIHSIFPNQYRNSVIVFTGDEDSQSGIFEFKENFLERKCLISGSQRARSCVGFPIEHGIIYATDSPLNSNEIIYLNLDNNLIETKTLAKINGPVIYGGKIGNGYCFSTSVEGDPKLKGLRYLLTYKRGPAVYDWKSHVYYGNIEIGFKEVFSKRKDFFSMCLFGFGTFQFPYGNFDEIICTGQSLYNLDGKTIKINL